MWMHLQNLIDRLGGNNPRNQSWARSLQALFMSRRPQSPPACMCLFGTCTNRPSSVPSSKELAMETGREFSHLKGIPTM